MGPKTLRLADGRRLAWYEFGDPRGRPCIYTTGTPAAGAAGELYQASATQNRVRWISIDKPGYGHSDFMAGRRLTDWPRDVTTLADHLGLTRFAVAGESGGGPHALALARSLPDRVTVALAISGLGPWHEGRMRRHMGRHHYEVYVQVRRDPDALREKFREYARLFADGKKCREWIRQVAQSPQEPLADRKVYRAHPEVLQIALRAYRGAFRQGPDAAIEELRMFTGAWGFDPGAIRVPVALWHGARDVNVPLASAQDLARRIPGCATHFIPGAGHTLYRHFGRILADVGRFA